jgi:hypothetical protein
LSSVAPRFVVVAGPARRRPVVEFIRAVARRSSWALWGAGLATLSLLNLAREIGLHFSPPPGAPREMQFMADLCGIAAMVGCGGGCLVVAVLAADEAIARGARRRTSYAVAVVLACLAAAIAQFAITYPRGPEVIPYRPVEVLLGHVETMAGVLADQLMICGLATFLYASVSAARRASEARHASEVQRLQASRQAFESRLQAMQARVEPQLLFNTLAHVRRLYETDPRAAGKMLDDLITYLRAALPHLRERSSTLAKEAALARAYLEIVSARLGDRLGFDISVPSAFAGARMPPMVLLPLIDHVLVHGLAPRDEGGTIGVATTVGGGRLLLAITDSGAGFGHRAEAGSLDAMVERLQALYGDTAELRFEQLADGGSQAILEIPYEPTDGGHR